MTGTGSRSGSSANGERITRAGPSRSHLMTYMKTGHDQRAAVLFNAVAGDLWRRFITYLPRHLAALGGVTQREFRQLVKVRFVKVAEYQARGVVHFHSLIRLDAALGSEVGLY